MPKVELGDGIAIYVKDKTIAEKLGHEVNRSKKKRPPEGTIDSLLPLFERLYGHFPQMVSPERTTFVQITESAPFTPEEAVNKLRAHGFSAVEVRDEVIERMFVISGSTPLHIKEQASEAVAPWLKKEILEIYNSTVESTGGKK